MNNYGATCMAMACQDGHLSVVQWLFEKDADTRAVNNAGGTCTIIACQNGHLSTAKWLFENGAADHISKANNNGGTPFWNACDDNHLPVCHWLVLKGALNRPEQDPDDEDAVPDPAAGHVDRDIVRYDTQREDPTQPDRRPALLAWAQGVPALRSA